VQGTQSYRVTLGVLIMAALAYALQQTMVVPALPVLQRDLHTTTAWATWLLTGFLLSASVATPLLGKLGDQHGKERLLLISLGIFLAGCVGAAAARDIWSLIAFRVLQGAAGAVFPLSFSIVRDEFPHERIGMAIGTISAIFGIGGGLGIVLSGVLVDNLSWRWIFIVGAIPVALAIVLVWRFVPESPIKTPSKLDLPGALLLSLGLVCLLLAITEGQPWGWGSARVVGLFVGAAALLAAWAAVELRFPEPLVDMRMLGERTVLFTNLAAFLAGFAMYSMFILVPRFVETPGSAGYGFGASPTRAGLYLLPGSLSMLLAGPTAGLLGRRYGSKWALALGMGLIGLGSAGLARWNMEPWQIVVGMLVTSVGVAWAFAAMSTLITEVVRASETGIANGMNAVARTVGGVVGAQIGAALLLSHLATGSSLPTRSGYVAAFAVSAVGALVGGGLAVLATSRARAAGAVAPAD
jgi:EmrB/QacA subfamily drug resistance transporter